MAALCGALASPPAARAQQKGQPQQAKPASGRQELVKEYRSVQQKLAMIQQKAMKDTALRARQQHLQQTVRSTMQEIDPKTEDRIDSLQSLQKELRAAQQAKDTAKLRKAFVSYQTLQQELQQTQRQAIQRDSISRQLDAFRSQLVSKMKEVDPTADSLLDRRDDLTARMKAAQQQALQGEEGQTPP